MRPLRVLLATDAVGGVWVYSLELARALKPLGIDAILAVMGPEPCAEQRAAAADLMLIDTGLPLDWMDTDADALRRAGEALSEIAERQQVDVVQTSSAALLADAEFACPVVAVQHSCVASWWAAVKQSPLPHEFAWRRDLVRRGVQRASAVVAPTRAFADETARIYDLDRVAAVHNGRRGARARGLPQGDFLFTCGRLWDEGKNAATLDRAAGLIDAPLQAAGPVAGLNGTAVWLEHARALGALSEERIAGVLAARPVFASAALYEPFGLSVLEAALAGCGLLLSDIPTHRELWDGAAIFIVPRDHSGFAAAARELLDDPDQRAELGRLAADRADCYSPERMAARMAGIYASVAQPQAQLVAGAA